MATVKCFECGCTPADREGVRVTCPGCRQPLWLCVECNRYDDARGYTRLLCGAVEGMGHCRINPRDGREVA